MANIKKTSFGGISGKITDRVYRIMNGKEFVSNRPAHYNAAQSIKAVEGRNNFAAATAFAQKVNSIPELKEIWRIARMKGTLPFNRIIKNNAALVRDGKLTINNTITPQGLSQGVKDLSVRQNVLNFIIYFDKNIIKPPFLLYLFFYLHEPKRKTYDAYKILSQVEKIEILPQPDKYILSINLEEEIKKGLTQYNNSIMYIAASGMEFKKKQVNWSSTTARAL